MKKKPGKTISIIIVNYNTRELLKECLRALISSEGIDASWEVFVVDNGSKDCSPEAAFEIIPSAHIIRLKENMGFAKANNAAIRRSSGKYVLLLNSDTEVNKYAINRVIDYMDNHNTISAITGKLVLPNGQIDPACHRGFPTPWAALTYFGGLERLFPHSRLFGQYHMGYSDMNVPHEIDCPSGAFFCVRKHVIDEIGLLDESFFMYGEDVDWAYRMKSRGHSIVYYPDAVILHKKKKSGRDTKNSIVKTATQRSFILTMKLFYSKHYENSYPWIITRVVYAVLWARLTLLSYLHI